MIAKANKNVRSEECRGGDSEKEQRAEKGDQMKLQAGKAELISQ